eukprot:COSAG06_NODE_2715_length_6403_cov_3.531567_6_plen_93_part_00
MDLDAIEARDRSGRAGEDDDDDDGGPNAHTSRPFTLKPTKRSSGERRPAATANLARSVCLAPRDLYSPADLIGPGEGQRWRRGRIRGRAAGR